MKKKHNWDKWFGRKRSFKLHKKKDYTDPASMAQQVRNAANERGVSVKIIKSKEALDVIILGTVGNSWKEVSA